MGVFRFTPPTLAGTVGAISESSFQLGSALGTAIVTSIQQSVEANTDTSAGASYESKFAGCAAAFTFLASLMAAVAIVTVFVYKPEEEYHDKDRDARVSQSVELEESKADDSAVVVIS